VFGPNGSGKTTLISLITSDHPQTYSLPIKLFGRTRLPQPGQPGISIFDLQQRIGHSSPEVHVFFPKQLSLRRTIESAWADTPLTKPKLTYEIDEKVNAALMWFRGELVPSLGPPKWMKAEMDRAVLGMDNGWFNAEREPADPERAAYHLKRAEEALFEEQHEMEGEDWADKIKFGELSFSAQRVALFIRAIIRNPDLVVLDEAFSGMDDFARDKCHLFLSHGEEAIFHLKRAQSPIDMPKITRSDLSRLGLAKVKGLQDSQALIVVSHKKEEVPGCVRNWICLPENGQGVPRFGHLDAPLELASSGWKEIWGEKVGMPFLHDFWKTLRLTMRHRTNPRRTKTTASTPACNVLPPGLAHRNARRTQSSPGTSRCLREGCSKGLRYRSGQSAC
jgi:ABC-type molybdenum transport system ATPase subunit/photorepair protein PhrA